MFQDWENEQLRELHQDARGQMTKQAPTKQHVVTEQMKAIIWKRLQKREWNHSKQATFKQLSELLRPKPFPIEMLPKRNLLSDLQNVRPAPKLSDAPPQGFFDPSPFNTQSDSIIQDTNPFLTVSTVHAPTGSTKENGRSPTVLDNVLTNLSSDTSHLEELPLSLKIQKTAGSLSEASSKCVTPKTAKEELLDELSPDVRSQPLVFTLQDDDLPQDAEDEHPESPMAREQQHETPEHQDKTPNVNRDAEQTEDPKDEDQHDIETPSKPSRNKRFQVHFTNLIGSPTKQTRSADLPSESKLDDSVMINADLLAFNHVGDFTDAPAVTVKQILKGNGVASQQTPRKTPRKHGKDQLVPGSASPKNKTPTRHSERLLEKKRASSKALNFGHA